MVDWMRFTSLKCGGAAGQWNLVAEGVRDLGGGLLVLSGTGAVTLSGGPGNPTGSWGMNYAIRLEGVPALIGGQDGHAAGSGELANGSLVLLATMAEGTFFAQSPALALGGAINPAKDLVLPVQNGAFC